MRKTIIKIIVCICVFVITLFIGSNVYNQGNADMTSEMSNASLPIVKMTREGEYFNTLHGLRQEVDGCFMRDTLTPLGENRSLSFTIDKYGNTIDELTFEVRSIDGTRLVEKTKVTDYQENDKSISASITIKDLIEQNTEYNWILLVTTQGETIRYYTRIMDAGDYHLDEKLAFVREFHEKTFDPDRVNELSTYMESNSKGDNTTLARVDIHSSLSQVAWAGLSAVQVTDSDVIVSEIDAQTASIRVNYMAMIRADGQSRYYNISEFYRVRYTSDRMYLLDFERTMNQIFDAQADVYASNKIMLGIRGSDVQMMESDGGSNLAFVNENQLFCYHAADKKMAYLFSFYEEKSGQYDIRTIYDHHGIKILNVDETGNVTFMVYGYMNRGSHEGTVGILVYEYNGMLNTIEEQIFIPCNKAYAVLKADVEQLSFVNKSGILYLYLDGSILAINLPEGSYTEIATQVQEGSFQVSQKEEMLVWQNSADAYDCTKLILMNLNMGNTREITATGNNRMMPLGFMNEDLIYGVAEYGDIIRDSSGSITFPMYAVYIQNEQGEILKNYHQDGIYVTGSAVNDNLITLKRVQKEAAGQYTQVSDDQIVNNIVEENGYNSWETVATQKYESIVQIVVKSTIETKSLKYTKPKEVLYEGSRDMLVHIEQPILRYYVYGKAGVMGTFSHPSDAINLAYSLNGVVVNENGEYIWKKTARSTRNQIMAITGTQADAETSQLAVCLETILSYAGTARKVQPLLDQGMTATEILAEGMNDVRILELSGVSLDAVLYYVNQDIPVLISLNDDSAVLVIGFNEQNIVVMDPEAGTVYKKGMNDSTKWFEENDNQFVAYIKEK